MDTDTQNHNPADAETGLPFSEAAIHVTYTRDRHHGGLFLLGLYVDLVALINKLADYVIPDGNPAKERFGEVMGGQILKLRSEELIEQGIEQGINQALYASVQDGDMLPERAAKRLHITVLALKKPMEANGYHFPEQQSM